MATKHGQEAITGWAAIWAAAKAKRKTIAVVVALVVIGLVLNEYVFVGTFS